MEDKQKFDLDSIAEFPPSYKPQNENLQNLQNPQINQEDDFDKFIKNFESTKLNDKKNTEITYKEIPTQNMKSKLITYKNKQFFFSFIAYSNINFIILSQEKKIGNLYEAEVEEPEYQLDQEEDEEELPPNYEVKCLLGNRFDKLNSFLSNFIAAFCFNIFEKAEKLNEIKPKFFKETEETFINKKIREDLYKEFYFVENKKSFFNEYVKSNSNLLMSLDLKIENLVNEGSESESEIKKDFDEFEISEKISEFVGLLRKEIIDILN